jgi:hypothetical protein
MIDREDFLWVVVHSYGEKVQKFSLSREKTIFGTF